MITHVEHKLITPEVEAAAQSLLAARNPMLVHIPDMSGRMNPAMVSAMIRSLTPLVFGVGAAPVVADPAPLMLHVSDSYDSYNAPQWQTKKTPAKATYSRKRRKSTMRRNRK